MVPTMAKLKQKQQVDNFQPNITSIRLLLIEIYGKRCGWDEYIAVLGGCVDETILWLQNGIQAADIWFQQFPIRSRHGL